MKINDTINVLPSEEAFNAWREILYFSSGIPFTLDAVKAAYFMDIGYRGGMNKFSPYSHTDAREFPWTTAVNSYKNRDDKWSEDMHTDIIDSLLNKCCLIQFGMLHPTFGDSDEFKAQFRAVSEKYCAVNKF